jgi:uncharacterized alkaline shock family protein YloU
VQKTERKPASGELKISRDVIAAIAKVAAMEVKGVDSLATSTAAQGFFPARFAQKPVDVALNDDFVTISISLNLKFGANITEVCGAVQGAVKDNVQTMTGMVVSKVNVLVAGIRFPDETKEEQAKSL